VLLMFSIGVEFSIPDLMRVKWVAIGGGTLGIAMSIALALIASWVAGWSLAQGIVVGATISVASTMVMARLLTDRGALGTTYGRVSRHITLVEDLAVVFMTVVLPVSTAPLKGPASNRLDAGKAASCWFLSFSQSRWFQGFCVARGTKDPDFLTRRHRHLPLPQRSRKHSVSP
jgi:CPA2 family monovalent cation:H+ antiporter-2